MFAKNGPKRHFGKNGRLGGTAVGLSGKTGEIAVRDVLDMEFPEEWMYSLTRMAPNVVDATSLSKPRPIADLCAMRKILGYVWLKSLPPLRYECVRTAFVPKARALVCLCCLSCLENGRKKLWWCSWA